MTHPRFMFVAGDPSGDQNTAPVIRQLKKELPDCECYGIGGPQMQAEGFVSLLPFEEFNRMGYVEVLTHLSFFLNAKKLLVREMIQRRPNLLVCVDYSGFNTPVMKEAHHRGIPVLWYIAPKIWAWKKKKHTANLKKYATHIATIFPFEVDLFLPYMSAVSFVGNPLVEFMDLQGYAVFETAHYDLRKREQIRLALVPGSRPHEIENILPAMVTAYKQLAKKYPQVSATISRCGHLPRSLYDRCCAGVPIAFFDGSLEELYSRSDIALVTSGTATLQTALMGVPMVIIYKTSYLTYLVYKTFIKGISHIGLPNIIAGEGIVPECIQDEMRPDMLVDHLLKYIEEPAVYASVRSRLAALKQRLGSKRPSTEVAALIKNIAGINSVR